LQEFPINFSSLAAVFGKRKQRQSHMPHNNDLHTSLLYVENYHYDSGLTAWIFDSFSPSCGASVTAASIGFIILFAAIAVKGYYLKKSQEPSRQVVLATAITVSVWVIDLYIT
jgi:hypothetical protein